MTDEQKIKRLEEIQKTIFDLAEKAENVIISYGSANDVRSALLQIRKESLNLFEVVSDIEIEFNNSKEDPSNDGIVPFEEDELTPLIKDHTCSKDDDRVIIFFTGAKKINKKHNEKFFPNVPLDKFRMTQGKRYIKVIRGGSVHCFIDRINGDVLKAASWNAPAKHARGNIWDDDNGLNCMSEYGAAYLRG